MQKSIRYLKGRLSNGELTLGLKKARLFVQSKHNGALKLAVRTGYSHNVHTQRRSGKI